MASIKLTGDTSGEITISAPAVAGTNTLTLPASTGTLTTTDVATNTPIVIAKITSAQTAITNSTWTKVNLDTTDIDTDSAFDTSTNYRFTVPSGKAGKYLINASVLTNSTANSNLRRSLCAVRKNGTEIKPRYDQNCDNNSLSSNTNHITLILDLAVGDYLELWGYMICSSGTGNFETGGTCLSLHKLIG